MIRCYHGNAHPATVPKCVMHGYTSRWTCMPNLIWNAFPLNFWHDMPLPWQHTFLHCQKVCFAQLHHTATMCAKFHFKCLKSVEVVQSAKFPHFLDLICRYHGNALSTIVKECISHITSWPTCGQNFTLMLLKCRNGHFHSNGTPKRYICFFRHIHSTLPLKWNTMALSDSWIFFS